MSRRAPLVALLTVLPLAACGTGAQEPPAVPAPVSSAPTDPAVSAEPIRIATGPTGQTAVLAHIYAGRLQGAGFDASVADAGGGRADYLAALQSGQVELAVDYSGNLYLHLRGRAPISQATDMPANGPAPVPTPTPTEAEDGLAQDLSDLLGLGDEGADNEDVLEGLREALPEHLRTLEPAPAENTVAVAVTQPVAVEFGLEDVEDLSRICQDIAIGTDLDFAGRSYGVEGLTEVYDCVPGEIAEIPARDELVTALLENRVQAATLFTATPAIEDNALVVLGDPLHNFVPQRVVPVAVEDLPAEAVEIVDEVSAGITTDDLVLMTRMTTAGDPYPPAEAARYWLEGDDDV